MAKSNKELVAELTAAYIASWSNCNSNVRLTPGTAEAVFNKFKQLIESMDKNESK